MRKEHEHLVSVLQTEIGAENVYQVRGLLTQVFDCDERERREILAEMFDASTLEAYESLLQKYDHQNIGVRSPADLAQDVIGGYPREWKEDPSGEIVVPIILPKDGLRHVRDSVSVLPSGILINAIRRLRRSGDSALMRAIFTHHPEFSTDIYLDYDREIQLVKESRQLASPTQYSLEGGNLQVLSRDSVALGVSYSWSNSNYDAQRYGYEKAIELIFEKDWRKRIHRIYVVHIPNFQHFWHLDSVFNMIGPKSAIAMPYIFGYPMSIRDSILPLVSKIAADLTLSKDYPCYPFHIPTKSDLECSGMTEVYYREDFDRRGKVVPSGKSARSFLDQLHEDGLLDLDKVIWVGGDPSTFSSLFEHVRVALREQASQACNVFVVRPFWVLAFDQNPHTSRALRDFLERHNGHLEVVPGRELVKSEGGPHCLVVDLQRGL